PRPLRSISHIALASSQDPYPDPLVLSFIPAERVRALLDAEGYVGDAPERAREMAVTLREAVAESAGRDTPLPGR
ncbi:hypothetical protein ACFLYD_04360, partial [Chloroflexota bacterium]